MSDERQALPSEDIFAKLPDSRPGSRSPRRRTTKADGRKGAERSAPGPRSRARTSAAAGPSQGAPEAGGPSAEGKRLPRDERSPQDGARRPVPPPHETPGIEDLAWAGVAAAAEAATIGVRLASRMFEALRGPTENR